MKLKSYLRRALAGALCLMICAAGLGQTAFAVTAPSSISSFNPSEPCTLKLHYLHDGVAVKLYKVAEVNKDVQFTPTDEFKGIGIDFNSCETAEEWRELALNLKRRIASAAQGEYNPIQEGRTIADGKGGGVITFQKDKSGKNLTPGLYLVVTEKYVREEKDPGNRLVIQELVYEVDPYLVSVPTWTGTNTQNGRWTYTVEGEAGNKAKSDRRREIGYMAIKIWHRSDGTAFNNFYYNGTIKLTLSKNGQIMYGPEYERVLSRVTGWYCTWEGLDNLDDWDVVELSGPGNFSSYVRKSSENSYTFEVVNTQRPTTPTDPTEPVYPRPTEPVYPRPSEPVYPRPSEPVYPRPSSPVSTPPPDVELEDPNVPRGDASAPPTRTSPPEEIELDDPDVPLGDLPQTGQLWWPVPMLAVGGVFLLLIGFIRHRNGEFDDE